MTAHGETRSEKRTDPSTTNNVKSLTHSDYTVGWVCALSKEQTAATAILSEIHLPLLKPSSDHNVYTLGSIAGHNVVITCLPSGDYGLVPASTVAKRMIDTFPNIKVGLMVGIGGGVPSAKVQLGDVVVSSPIGQFAGVVQYDRGKDNFDGFERTGSLNRPPTVLLTALQSIKTKHDLEGSQISQFLRDVEEKYPRLMASGYTRSDSLEDPLFTPRSEAYRGWRAVLLAFYSFLLNAFWYLIGLTSSSPISPQANGTASAHLSGSKRQTGDVHVHYGLIASGNRVVKDAFSRDRLNEQLDGHVLCFETEAAGLMNDFPCIVIRGICDYADAGKNKDWQEYAAMVAAAYTKELLHFIQPGHIDAESPVRDILHNVGETLDTINIDIQRISARMDRKDDLKILNWLTKVDYGPQHSDFSRKRQAGTGQWLLSSAEYQILVNSKSQTLFCPGDPGVGKTILTATVIDDLIERFPHNQSTRIVYVYCNFNREHEQRLEYLIAALIKQLSQARPTLPESLTALYQKHQIRRTRPSAEELSEVLQSVASLYTRIFVVVDALDECQRNSGCRSRFLSQIFALQDAFSINFFATSRPIPEIEETFEKCLRKHIIAPDEDIRSFLQSEIHMPQMPKLIQREEDLQKEISSQIVDLADGIFLLAQLHISSLVGSTTKREIRNALKAIPKGADGYDYAYNQAVMRIKCQPPLSRRRARKALSWLTCAKRQLSIPELEHALATEGGDREFDVDNITAYDEILSVCAGLVTVDEESNVIRLVHYTVQEYLERTQGHWFPDSEDDENNPVRYANPETYITRISLTYMSFASFELEGKVLRSWEDIEERLESSKLYSYSAQNWGNHARKASNILPDIMTFLDCGNKVGASSHLLWYEDRNFQDFRKTNMTGLHMASYFGIVDAVELLLQRGHDVPQNITGRQFNSACDLESKDRDDQTPLVWAARNGHLKVVHQLLDEGANMNTDSEDTLTPLSWSSANGHEMIVKLFLEKGANADCISGGQTPLLWAADNGHTAVVEELLQKGVALEASDEFGQTPLILAAMKGYLAISELLLAKGASPDLTNDGIPPIIWAAGNGYKDVVKLLLSYGVSIECRDGDWGHTPLARAAEKGKKTVVQFLLDKGADIESKGEDGLTPLLWAAWQGHEAVVGLLLDHNADIKAKDERYKRTALAWAGIEAKSPMAEAVVQLLLDRGADIESKSDDGRTVLELAAQRGYKGVIKVLLDNGAVASLADGSAGEHSLPATTNDNNEQLVELLMKSHRKETKNAVYQYCLQDDQLTRQY
ncbi:hypothetical protein N7493_005481 [Penicillium malachiteum]|uniref:Nucleoside phosphorylase domain-containing protein n=1 Tax=Penicillium malachiteum TaxID=1324776 RepID=A0AAD6MWM6_9EURO|nr:hypothetical protein N7493_005481 [Penicillium malachiteum]